MKQFIIMSIFVVVLITMCVIVAKYIEQYKICEILKSKDYNSYIDYCIKE